MDNLDNKNLVVKIIIKKNQFTLYIGGQENGNTSQRKLTNLLVFSNFWTPIDLMSFE
jgi:hypothetical protein